MTPNFDAIHLTRTYPSKILLFGEYTVLLDSMALAMPFGRFSGQWNYGKNYNFEDFSHYLNTTFPHDFNFEKWQLGLNHGLYFESTIPIGYGLGSSGSVVAAVYQDFFENKTTDFKELKRILGKIETYFHGHSSGFDPLIAYTNKAFFNKKTDLFPVDFNQLPLQNLYLLDSKINRNTANLVNQFNIRMRDYTFQKHISHLQSLVQNIIPAFVDNDLVWKSIFKDLSLLQLEVLYPFIPPKVKKFWQDGINNQSHFTKLCGAGGGGCFLVFCEEKPTKSGLIPLKLK